MSIFSAIGTTAKGLFTGGMATLWSKLSLWLGYLAISMAITLGCAAIWFYKQNTTLHEAVGTLKTKVDAQKGDIAQLQLNNVTQDKAIADLTSLRATDNAVVNGLLNDFAGISKDTKNTKAKLRDLENHSDQVKSYLNTPLPASVRSVLNGKDPAAASSVHSH